MAIVRLWQYPFEMEFVSPRGMITDGWDTIAVSSNDPYTGTYSVRHSGRIGGGVGVGFTSSINDIRLGVSFKHNWIADDTVLFQAVKTGITYDAVYLKWMEDEWRFDLYVDNVLVEQVSVFDIPGWAIDDNWVHLGVHIIGGSRVVISVDGIAIIDYSDAGVPSAYDGVFFGQADSSGYFAFVYFDDLYIDSVVGESYAVPPSHRFLFSKANADGTSQDWTSKAGGVDIDEVDDAAPDDDTSYVWINVTGQNEFFNTTNITVPADHSIVAAIPIAVVRKGNAATASQLRLGADNGVKNMGSDQDLPTWYAELWERQETDPSAAPWTESSFNSNQFGCETRGTF